MSSSQLCEACYSSGMACCSHDSTCLRLSCMVPQVSDYIRHSPAGGLQEFQFFGHDDRSLGLPHHHSSTPMVDHPGWGIKYQKNPRSNITLTFDICSSTTTSSSCSLGNGSCPLDVPVMAQVASSASAVSFWGSCILTDASTGRGKEISNKAAITATGQGDSSSADREAKLLRYREKKAMRNYDKQVRYESRKKYAEIRPRVRGRFAKSSNSDQPSPAPEYNPSHYGTGSWFSTP